MATKKLQIVGSYFSDQIEAAIANKIDAPSTSDVGHALVVKAIDENGKPIEWETIDIDDIATDTGINVYPVVESTNAIIEPDKYQVFGVVDSLRVTLQDTDNDYAHEYCFEFTTDNEFYGMVITPEPKWAIEPAIEANKTYQVSILRGIGVIVGA